MKRKYRMLKVGDIVSKGDQYLTVCGKWKEATMYIGDVVNGIYRGCMRTPIDLGAKKKGGAK
jgi:hypothetical protein